MEHTFHAGQVSTKFQTSFTNLINKFYPQVSLQFAFKSKHRIGSYFRYKDIVPKSMRARVVYKYTCKICKDFYVGKCLRDLDSRITEHRGLSSRNHYSAIRDHMNIHQEHVDPDCFTILSQADNDLDLKILETLFAHDLKPAICKQPTSLSLHMLM